MKFDTASWMHLTTQFCLNIHVNLGYYGIIFNLHRDKAIRRSTEKRKVVTVRIFIAIGQVSNVNGPGVNCYLCETRKNFCSQRAGIDVKMMWFSVWRRCTQQQRYTRSRTINVKCAGVAQSNVTIEHGVERKQPRCSRSELKPQWSAHSYYHHHATQCP